jgi:hypothetical protein
MIKRSSPAPFAFYVENIFLAEPADYVKAQQRVYRTPESASFVDLPVAP